MDVMKAISEIRKRLDEIEELVKHLPESKSDTMLPNMYSPTAQMRDWMDMNDIPKDGRIRCSLLRVAKLANDGLTLSQIKNHRLVRAKKKMAPFIDDFFAKWSSR
jgi:hypothetical protein